MSTRQAFRLTALHANGAAREHIHSKLKDARLYLSYALHDNGYADKSTAQRLCMIQPGESVTVAGATFSIDQVPAP